MVTALPGLALGILTADCAPVLFADAEAGVIGAAHAGWKGAVAACWKPPSPPWKNWAPTAARIAAAIGPTHLPGQLRSGRGFPRPVSGAGPSAGFSSPPDRPGHFRFDLPGYVAQGWRKRAWRRSAIWRFAPIPRKTAFSAYRRTTHRGEADYGRQISAIVLTR